MRLSIVRMHIARLVMLVPQMLKTGEVVSAEEGQDDEGWSVV